MTGAASLLTGLLTVVCALDLKSSGCGIACKAGVTCSVDVALFDIASEDGCVPVLPLGSTVLDRLIPVWVTELTCVGCVTGSDTVNLDDFHCIILPYVDR